MGKGRLGLLLLTLCLAAGRGEGINLDEEKNDRYTQRHPKSSIDYTSCEDMYIYNEPDYSTTESPGHYEACHVNFLPKLDEENTCCPTHDYLATGVCSGKDKNGANATFQNVAVCLPESGSETAHSKVHLNCPLWCTMVEVSMADASVKGDILTINGEDGSFSNFCVGYKCNDIEDEHDHDHDHQLWQKTYEVCDCKEADNSGLNDPLCCGEDGIYDPVTMTCSQGTMPAAVADNLAACNSTRQNVAATEPNKQGAICNSFTNDGQKAVECREHCPGEKCIQMCSEPRDALNLSNNSKVTLPEDYDVAKMLGVEKGELVYGNGYTCQTTDATIYLYPDWQCNDRVEFLADGSMRKVANNRTALYGEFCVEPLAGDTRWGEYRITTCWKKENSMAEEEGQKQDFTQSQIRQLTTTYHVIFWISIICLLITIILYAAFRNALLRSDYNKIMLNYAACLLVAFLTMVVHFNLGGKDQTWKVCAGVTITNQFFFHSAFCLMTLMSYNISRQIQGNIQEASSGFLKQLLIAYAIPGVIALITLIVEISAPKCSSIRPKFGMKSCHFYGDNDKFVWFYLPVLIMLLINTAMFIFIMINLVKNMRSGSSGKKCIYLRLFLGMGIVWYAEILSWVLKDADVSAMGFVFTNALNMSQGVWVFLIFVCNRNVLNVVTNKSRHLYNVVGHMGNSMALRPQVAVASSRTDQFSVSSASYAPVREETGL